MSDHAEQARLAIEARARQAEQEAWDAAYEAVLEDEAERVALGREILVEATRTLSWLEANGFPEGEMIWVRRRSFFNELRGRPSEEPGWTIYSWMMAADSSSMSSGSGQCFLLANGTLQWHYSSTSGHSFFDTRTNLTIESMRTDMTVDHLSGILDGLIARRGLHFAPKVRVS
jgi:hypothetical protein